jgi:prepilin-type N-terminal cleavage/methylation domain-containing protein
MKTRKYKHGLSLVEMLIVVGVIALLTTMVISIASRVDNQSKEHLLKSTFALLEGALEEYRDYQGTFPVPPAGNFNSVAERATAYSEYLYGQLYSIPSSRKILDKISGSLIKHDYDSGAVPPVPEIYDPWGTALDYRYEAGENFPELVSAGPDKIFGSADDITNR